MPVVFCKPDSLYGPRSTVSTERAGAFLWALAGLGEPGRLVVDELPEEFATALRRAATQVAERVCTEPSFCGILRRGANITLRVTPIERGSFPKRAMCSSTSESIVRQLGTVQRDSKHGPEFTYTAADLTTYHAHLNWMAESSLTAEESRDVIHAIARLL